MFPPSTISRITDSVSSDSLAWQNRPLDPFIFWIGWYRFKVRETQKVINKTIYLVGLNRRQEGSARNVVKQERKR
jgi:transposase-like protein